MGAAGSSEAQPIGAALPETVGGPAPPSHVDFVLWLPAELVPGIIGAAPLAPSDVARMRLVCRGWARRLADGAVFRALSLAHWRHLRRVTVARPWEAVWRQLEHAARIANDDGDFAGCVDYLDKLGLLAPGGGAAAAAADVAALVHGTERLDRAAVGDRLFGHRSDALGRAALEALVRVQRFGGVAFPDCVRLLCAKVRVTCPHANSIGLPLRLVIDRFAECNPCAPLFAAAAAGWGAAEKQTLLVVGYSLVILSTDLFSPNNPCKMSRAAFVANVRSALESPDYAPLAEGRLAEFYDNVRVFGHVCEGRRQQDFRQALRQLERGGWPW